MKSDSASSVATSGSGVFSSPDEMLGVLDAMDRGMTRVVARVRKMSAPPDGRKRDIVPMTIKDAAQILGVSASTIKNHEDHLDPPLRWNSRKTARVFYPDDIRRLRHLVAPSRGTEGLPPMVVAIANQKGGVGKTTTTVTLAQAAAMRGNRVLLIDLDPQASATSSFLIESTPGSVTLKEGSHADLSIEATITPVLLGETKGDGLPFTIRDLVRRTHWPSIDIIPSLADLSEAEFGMIKLLMESQRTKRPVFWRSLRDALRTLSVEDYDLVLIDTPPTMSLTTVAVSLASHGMVIPVPPRNLDIESLKAFIRTNAAWLQELRQAFPLELQWVRILTTMMSPNTSVVEARNDSLMRQELGGSAFVPSPVLRMEALQRASGGAPTPYEVQPAKPVNAKRSAAEARHHLDMVYQPLFGLIEATFRSWGMTFGEEMTHG
jgi:chromosome partitioning protein